MMSITARAAGAAASYYAHLSADAHRAGGELDREDYYSRDRGEWHGAGAAALGLTGAVEASDFAELCAGFDPGTGAALAQNAGENDRTALFDCTFSVPKSVSVAWSVGDESTRSTIERLHDEAVRAALGEIQERAISTRRGHGGAQQERVEMIASTWRHGTSRELDPQLHTHATILNVCQRADGSWGTLDGSHLYDLQKIFGASYRLHLEQALRENGFGTERDGESFRVSAVPHALERDLSKRRNQIEAALRERGARGAKASEVAALGTRKAKDHNVSADDLRAGWRQVAAEYGYDEAAARPLADPVQNLDLPAAAGVLDEATEFKAILRAKDIEYRALVDAMGTGQGRAAAGAVAKEAAGQAVKLRGPDGKIYYTTRELIDAERSVMTTARAGTTASGHQISDRAVDAALTQLEQANGFALSDEQAAAVRSVTTEPGKIKVIVGDAGTGKSTSMQAVRLAYAADGYEVVGTAPSSKAAGGLEEGTGIKSTTIDSLLGRIDAGKLTLTERSVIVLDEAGMVDSRRMAALVDAADRAGAKLIMVGDHKQLQPVGPGTVFRHLADDERGVGHARLEDIRRQRDGAERDAVRQLSRGEAAEAMRHYIDQGRVEVKQTHTQAVREVAQKYVAAADEVDKDQALALASTNARVRDINQAVRSELESRGELSDSREVTALRELGTDRKTGELKTETEKMQLATGDRVLYAGTNDYRADLRRGDLGTVVGFDDQGGVQVRLDRDGSEKTIDPARQDLRHGYAITTHRAQGATVERAVVLASSDTSREMAYVQGSRARDTTEWVTTRHTVQRQAQQAGVELARDDKQLDQFRAVVDAMSKSRQAESTLDYTEVKDEPQAEQPARERDAVTKLVRAMRENAEANEKARAEREGRGEEGRETQGGEREQQGQQQLKPERDFGLDFSM